MNKLIEFTYEKNLAHLSSSLTTYPILHNIFEKKKEEDIVILSAGHAGLALYFNLQKFYNIDANMLYEKHGLHPHYDPENKIFCSSGSLGLVILIATGMAYSNRNKKIYCVISDGECDEGSVWEALRFININNIDNIEIIVNMNGLSAYQEIDSEYLTKRLKVFLPRIIIVNTYLPNIESNGVKGILAHYYKLKEHDKNELITYINSDIDKIYNTSLN